MAAQLRSLGVPVVYEARDSRIHYLIEFDYTPDFVLPNGIIIETKGLFSSEDRRKHRNIQKQHPEKDIRFVFSNSRAKLRKGSTTTYGDWCDRHGFLYADRLIPTGWINEAPGGKTTAP